MIELDVKPPNNRIDLCFEKLAAEKRAAFISFIMAGDPDLATSSQLLSGLPDAGVDIIEIGVPFTDPMADGQAIQWAGQRALAAGMNLKSVLAMVCEFRKENTHTPIVLMGYYNPIYHFGVDDFLKQAKQAGVDGLIVVDLPPEEDGELCLPAAAVGLRFIRLATPTTDDKRLPRVLQNASGFIYYVSVAGVTGTLQANLDDVAHAVADIKQKTNLPVCVGFGVRSPEQVAKIAQHADGVVVGSAIIQHLVNSQSVAKTLEYVKDLAKSTPVICPKGEVG